MERASSLAFAPGQGEDGGVGSGLYDARQSVASRGVKWESLLVERDEIVEVAKLMRSLRRSSRVVLVRHAAPEVREKVLSSGHRSQARGRSIECLEVLAS